MSLQIKSTNLRRLHSIRMVLERDVRWCLYVELAYYQHTHTRVLTSTKNPLGVGSQQFPSLALPSHLGLNRSNHRSDVRMWRLRGAPLADELRHSAVAFYVSDSGCLASRACTQGALPICLELRKGRFRSEQVSFITPTRRRDAMSLRAKHALARTARTC
jgi:hypothetical protein